MNLEAAEADQRAAPLVEAYLALGLKPQYPAERRVIELFDDQVKVG